jgi:hypothetical protein
MSRGSTFVILRKDKPTAKVTENQVMEQYNSWYNAAGEQLKFETLPELSYYNCYSYVDKKSLELLTKLVESDFNSSFTSLIEYYNLSYYQTDSRSDRVVINVSTARSMVQAIKYLLYEDYSKRTEALLDNEWIDVFGEDCIPYREWKDEMDYEDEDDSQWCLKRLRQILETYLFISSESDDEITLLYYAWG